MLRLSSLFFILLMGCSCRTEFSIKCDDKVDTTYYHAPDDKNYYLSDGDRELYIGTYRQAPVLHKFDSVCLIECGNKNNELLLVTTAAGNIKLANLISQVYELYPASKYFPLFVDAVRQEPDGKISISLYSPTEDKELMVHLDSELKLVLPQN